MHMHCENVRQMVAHAGTLRKTGGTRGGMIRGKTDTTQVYALPNVVVHKSSGYDGDATNQDSIKIDYDDELYGCGNDSNIDVKTPNTMVNPEINVNGELQLKEGTTININNSEYINNANLDAFAIASSLATKVSEKKQCRLQEMVL